MKLVCSLDDILKLYWLEVQSQYPPKKAREIKSQTETAVHRYTLPGWGFSTSKGRKFTQAEYEAAILFRQKVSLEKFVLSQQVQDEVFELLKASQSIRNVYRSRLKHLLKWCAQQSWWPSSAPAKGRRKDRCPGKRRIGYGSFKDTPLVERPSLPAYGLRPEQFSPQLATQMEQFEKFRTASHWPQRQELPVKPDVCLQQMRKLRLVLGWFHHYQGVSQAELSFDTLIPFVKLKGVSNQEATDLALMEAAEYVEIWLCEFLNFLETERQIKNAKTIQSCLIALLALMKFQYHRQITSRDYREIPMIEQLRHRLNLLNKDLKNQVPGVDIEKKWLDLPQIWEQVVEPLRAECQPRLFLGHKRSPRAIGSSVQIYVLWGLLTYSPPRRQQEFRGLKIALSCDIQRPLGVEPDGLYHPLPKERFRDSCCGYLHKTPQGKWIKEMSADSYKTGNTYGHQVLEIPNINFPDGTCFYDYLEMWLYGYYLAPNGSLRSCGSSFYPQSASVQHCYGCRSVFEPVDDHVFVQYHGKPFDRSNFGKYFSNAAHALTGKRVTPHLLRDIFATHFLKHGASDADIASLAYGMGHSPQVLRKIYDRRNPAQKHQPIQEVLLDLVQQSLL